MSCPSDDSRPVILPLRERFALIESTEMGARLKFFPIVLLLFLVVLGCNNVKLGDLPGTWVMTDASRQVLPAELQKASATIVLDGNGTFVATDLPGLFCLPGRH